MTLGYSIANFVHIYIYIYIYIYIQQGLVDKSSIIIYFPSAFCLTLGHHQRRMYYKSDATFVCTLLLCKKSVKIRCIDVILTECNLSLHEITPYIRKCCYIYELRDHGI